MTATSPAVSRIVEGVAAVTGEAAAEEATAAEVEEVDKSATSVSDEFPKTI